MLRFWAEASTLRFSADRYAAARREPVRPTDKSTLSEKSRVIQFKQGQRLSSGRLLAKRFGENHLRVDSGSKRGLFLILDYLIWLEIYKPYNLLCTDMQRWRPGLTPAARRLWPPGRSAFTHGEWKAQLCEREVTFFFTSLGGWFEEGGCLSQELIVAVADMKV